MLAGRTMRPLGSWLRHPLVHQGQDLDFAIASALMLPDLTMFLCKLDKSKCDHEWNNEGCNPTHCLKCGQSFTAYAFMEAP